MPKKSLRIESFGFAPPEQALPAGRGRLAIAPAALLGSDETANVNHAMLVGFIGLDHTGKAVASRLLKAGQQLAVYDPDREITEALAAAGGIAATSVEDACRSADAVFTMLPDDEVAKAVILGPGGVVESLPRGAIHIGLSTVSVECADRFVEAHWDAGQQYVSAPVLVGPGWTAVQQLLVIAGGCDATIFQVEPLLRHIGQVEQLSGWPSDANLIQLGASYMGADLLQFLASHPELCARHHRSQLARPASPLAQFLGIETQGVLQ